MSLTPLAHAHMNAASSVTVASATSAVLFWGLHISDIAVIISSFAAMSGVLLQFYLAFKKDKKNGP